MLKEFKEFAMRGNVMDMAVGVIIGAAFGKIVASLVEDVMMPPLGQLIGKVDFSAFFLSLYGKSYASLAEAKAAHAATLNYGIFLNNVINFDCRFRGVPGRSASEPLDQETGASGGAHHEGVPPVRDDHSHCGEALRPLHCPT